jgi:hypothetical protein
MTAATCLQHPGQRPPPTPTLASPAATHTAGSSRSRSSSSSSGSGHAMAGSTLQLLSASLPRTRSAWLLSCPAPACAQLVQRTPRSLSRCGRWWGAQHTRAQKRVWCPAVWQCGARRGSAVARSAVTKGLAARRRHSRMQPLSGQQRARWAASTVAPHACRRAPLTLRRQQAGMLRGDAQAPLQCTATARAMASHRSSSCSPSQPQLAPAPRCLSKRQCGLGGRRALRARRQPSRQRAPQQQRRQRRARERAACCGVPAWALAAAGYWVPAAARGSAPARRLQRAPCSAAGAKQGCLCSSSVLLRQWRVRRHSMCGVMYSMYVVERSARSRVRGRCMSGNTWAACEPWATTRHVMRVAHRRWALCTSTRAPECVQRLCVRSMCWMVVLRNTDLGVGVETHRFGGWC